MINIKKVIELGLIDLKADLVNLNKTFLNCSSLTRTVISSTKIMSAKNADKICLPCDRLSNFISTNRPFVSSAKSEIDRGLESFMARYSVELNQWLRTSESIKRDCGILSSLGREIRIWYEVKELWDTFIYGADIIFGDVTDVRMLRKYNTSLSNFEFLSTKLAREAIEWNRRLRMGAR